MKSPEIRKAASHQQTNWSGGSTTELFIFPSDRDFKERDFKFRLSTATVDIERSEFTALPGFDRLLMVLNGELRLSHEGHHTVKLKTFDTDRFKGDWQTMSEGVCVDFNLIYKAPLIADLHGVKLFKGDCLGEKIENTNFVFVYCYSGTLSVLFNKSVEVLNAGDLWWVEAVEDEVLVFEGIENTSYVCLKIQDETKGV